MPPPEAYRSETLHLQSARHKGVTQTPPYSLQGGIKTGKKSYRILSLCTSL